jgi:hypothetical protein
MPACPLDLWHELLLRQTCGPEDIDLLVTGGARA